MIEHGDGLPDDRVLCERCTQRDPDANWCRARRFHVIRELPVRCVKFIPLRGSPDQRTGQERWPGLEKLIAEVREMDRLHAMKRHSA